MDNIVKVKNFDKVKDIFGDWENNFLLSCMQGMMGKVYSYEYEGTKSAMAIIGDFRILAGIPDEKFLNYKRKDFEIIIPQNKEWSDLIVNTFPNNYKKITRYSTFEDINQFDIPKLKEIKNSIPDGFEILDIDKELYSRCLKNNWSKDLVGNYENYEDYSNKGIGVVLLDKENDVIVSGASSYCTFKSGIEIEIDTDENYRRRGYAFLSGASIILKCLEKGIYPSWDAHNIGSIKLAEKLGYKIKREYDAFELYKD